MRTRVPEDAEAIPFSRMNIAAVLEVSVTRVNNWIDRNRLWQTHRGRKFHRLYSVREVFDLAGFAAMRAARIPEKECARYVYSYGFFRRFLRGDQETKFSYRRGKWDIGVYDPSAILTLTINMRSVGASIFRKIAEAAVERPADWPEGTFEGFRRLYDEARKLDLLDPGAAPLFEAPRAGVR